MERACKPWDGVWDQAVGSLWPPQACRSLPSEGRRQGLRMPGCETAGLKPQVCVVGGKNPKPQTRPSPPGVVLGVRTVCPGNSRSCRSPCWR